MGVQAGNRIRLDWTDDEYTRLQPGSEGVVTGVRDHEPYPQIHVKWDEGSNLSLIPGVDRFTILEAS